MTKVIIIDDEPLARDLIKEYLGDYSFMNLVQECGDGFEGVKAITQLQPDLIFLDIQMPKINGFEMLELLDEPPHVIFTTAFDEYAIKAFDAHAIDYLLKPFSKERFDKAIQKILNGELKIENEKAQWNNIQHSAFNIQHSNRVVVKNGSKISIIPVHEIVYLEGYDDYIKIHTAKETHLKKKTMNYFETVLNPSQFVRVHRSFMVQVNQVTRIEPYQKEGHIVILKSGEQIPVSKTGYPKLKSILGL